MKRFVILVLGAIAIPVSGMAALTETQELALRDIDRCMTMVDAVWSHSIKGTDTNLYLGDTYDLQGRGSSKGVSDVWPYTAVIEAHCSLLEALDAAKNIAPDLYSENYEKYVEQLDKLIDNLEWYRGTYNLASYAVGEKAVSPYGVHRGGSRGHAAVTGIENVYDDQMWLARELIRAYRITGNNDYLDEATYLTDYVLEGWDCWRDGNGEEFGGITWGPGYNSKHACSNSPIIQPLVWLSDIYGPTDKTMEYYYRDNDNEVVMATVNRSEHYLDFAKKVYSWQKRKLLHNSGCYWDMMGADHGKIEVKDGYRQHVNNGGPTGNQYSYNTGTMIAGAAELYRVTGEESYLEDLEATTKASLNQFAKYQRSTGHYLFNTDAKASEGFNSWFNDVLMRSYADADAFVEGQFAKNGLESFQYNLDYAFENYNDKDYLPINFLDGWNGETVTKGFHQSAFASEYGVLAKWLLSLSGEDVEDASVDTIEGDAKQASSRVYSINGIDKGDFNQVKDSLPHDIYIMGSKKIVMGK